MSRCGRHPRPRARAPRSDLEQRRQTTSWPSSVDRSKSMPPRRTKLRPEELISSARASAAVRQIASAVIGFGRDARVEMGLTATRHLRRFSGRARHRGEQPVERARRRERAVRRRGIAPARVLVVSDGRATGSMPARRWRGGWLRGESPWTSGGSARADRGLDARQVRLASDVPAEVSGAGALPVRPAVVVAIGNVAATARAGAR